MSTSNEKLLLKLGIVLITTVNLINAYMFVFG